MVYLVCAAMDPGQMILVRSYSSIARFVGIVCSILGVVGSPAVASQTPSPPKTIFGVYGRPTAGQDSIQITQGVNEKIGVALKLYFSSGHSCQLKQAGEWRGDHVAVVAEGLDPGQSCKLSVYFDKNRVLLKDEGLHCAPVYCGTRGKLDSVSLPKFSPKRK